MPKFDRLIRYRVVAVLFLLLYILLMSRTIFQWPNWDQNTLRGIWYALTTPTLILILWNVGQESWTILRRRRIIDRMLKDSTSASQERQGAERL